MKKTLLTFTALISAMILWAQDEATDYGSYTPEQIKQYVDEGNDLNKVVSDDGGYEFTVFKTFVLSTGYVSGENEEMTFYMLKNSKDNINDALYLLDDPPSAMAGSVLEYISLVLDNGHNYDKAHLENVKMFFHGKEENGWPVSINNKDNYGNYYITFAAKYNLAILLEHAISEKANTNIQDKTGSTALHYAVKNGNQEMVEKLIKAKANINMKDDDGNTPLLLACKKGDWETARLLVKNKANTKIPNKAGEKPMDFAKTKGEKGVLKGK